MVVARRFAGRVAESGAVPVVPEVDHEVRVPARGDVLAWAGQPGLVLRRHAAWRSAAAKVSDVLIAERPAVVVADPRVPWVPRLCARSGIGMVPFWTTHSPARSVPGLVLVNSLRELQPRAHRFGRRFRFVGPLVSAGPAEQVPWHRVGGGPLLLVSPGTVFARSPRFFRAIAEQFGGTEWSVVMATAHTAPEDLGPLPGNVLARRWLPQFQLLRHAAAFVTHAGMNSVQEAMVCGVPMVLAPRTREQRATAKRVRELGLGEPMPETGRLRESVCGLVSSERVRSAVTEVRERLAVVRSGAAAADELLRLV
ncbi:nucleotide disphospho-sugar-binding domain-containing protein [Amycolatopsis sp. YIM 10]|uniref:nucleotide disphospho-sugar-binding domain-containing protein n=1 Tax=Amycolatopsis sp. YIM 10 TaxID=2653857 RepID=UPI001D14F0BF|nr:nucleotide disphospho-sugar-binding domain-containing protein [Amycolatopsis sp. YIM 10]